MYWLDRLGKHYDELCFEREVVTHNKNINYHIHGHFQVPKDEPIQAEVLYFKKGYHVWFEPVDIFNWHKYISKDPLTYDQVKQRMDEALNLIPVDNDSYPDIDDHIDATKYPKLFPPSVRNI